MKTFKFHTLGCKVNQYETQLMREQLLNAGLKEVHPHTKDFGVGVNSNTPADIYIVNTCTVTADSDRECRRFLRHSIKENAKAIIIAAGCYIEKDEAVIKEINSNIVILKNSHKKDILKIVTDTMGTVTILPLFSSGKTWDCPQKLVSVPIISHFKGHTKAFIKIQDGCDNFCSYCKVPYVRGAPKSRNKDEIIQEAKTLIKNNYKELVLCGICLGAYGQDSNDGISLKDILLDMRRLGGDFRIRLSSIELRYITDELIDVIKNNDKICNHLHIPFQSGDDEVLNRMNRRYTSLDFIERVDEIKMLLPGIAISTDVLVGFPGEGEEAFKNTINCIKKIQPMRTHIFSYSKREGTAAYNFKDVVDNNKIAMRYKILKELTDSFALEYYEYSKAIPQRILVENKRDKTAKKLCGYSDTYARFLLDGPDEWMGKFISAPL